MARGPWELQNSSRRRRQKQQVPYPRPHLWGSVNKRGGWHCPPLLKALIPGKEAASPALALQVMLGGPEERSSFLPSHSFCCQDP